MFVIGFAALLAFSARMEAGRVAYSIDLFNNTENAVELVRPREIIFPGKSKSFRYNEGVTIRVDGRQVHFERVDPPKDYVHGGIFSETLRAQINSNMTIWILPPAASRPALTMPRQPEGFPLSPR